MGQAKIDGDLIMATLAANAGDTLPGNHGVMYSPYYGKVERRYIGAVTLPSGVLQPSAFFFKVEAWQNEHAKKLVQTLNRDLHHDGAWSVLWNTPLEDGRPTKLNIAFQDVDGDIRFIIESDRTLPDLLANGPESHLNSCENAYRQMMGWVRDVEIKPGQTIKFAQGQDQADPTVHPLI